MSPSFSWNQGKSTLPFAAAPIAALKFTDINFDDPSPTVSLSPCDSMYATVSLSEGDSEVREGVCPECMCAIYVCFVCYEWLCMCLCLLLSL